MTGYAADELELSIRCHRTTNRLSITTFENHDIFRLISSGKSIVSTSFLVDRWTLLFGLRVYRAPHTAQSCDPVSDRSPLGDRRTKKPRLAGLLSLLGVMI